MILKDVGSPWRVKQLDDDTLAYIVPDAKPRVNAGKMCATVTITTETLDRDGDVIVTKGVDLTDHKNNPVVFLAHRPMLVVGKAEDPMGNYTVKAVGTNRIDATTYFCKSSRLGEEAFRLVEEGIFRGASIGFSPVTAIVEKRVNPNGIDGKTYKRCRPHEYSHLPNNSNPECLVRVVEKGFGGKRLCDPLYELLAPLVPERSPVVRGGFDPKVTKAMNPDDDTLNGGGGPDTQVADPMAPPGAGGDTAGGMDPNGQPPAVDPHKDAVNNAVGTMMASWYDQLCNGSIDADKFKEMMSHLADTRDVHAAGAMGDEGDGDADDLDFDDDEGDDKDGDADDDMDTSDLNDDDKDRAEKMCQMVWTKGYAGTMTRVGVALHRIAEHPNPDPRKVQRSVRKMLAEMGSLPTFAEVVEKAVRETRPTAPPAEDYSEALHALNGLANRIEGITG